MLEPGQLVDEKYRIIRIVGRGGMGVVYEAENVRIQRRVAIKVLHTQLSQGGEEFIERFEHEAQAAARIGSPHIVDVLDLGNLPNADRYLVMEYLSGETLGAYIAGRGDVVPAEDLIPIVTQMLDALTAAHAAGIVHRDVKPDNVFLLPSPGRAFVKLVDFGASKFVAAAGTAQRTLPGAVLGTPEYMAPEQARGATTEVDLRSDIYSVGVILYEALSGQSPFTGANVNEILFKVALSPPPPLEVVAPELPQELVAIVQRAMSKAREDRFQSAVDMRAALATWLLKWASAQRSGASHADLARRLEPIEGPRRALPSGSSDGAIRVASRGPSRSSNPSRPSNPSHPSYELHTSSPEMFERTLAAGPSLTTGSRNAAGAPSATGPSADVSLGPALKRSRPWIYAAAAAGVVAAALVAGMFTGRSGHDDRASTPPASRHAPTVAPARAPAPQVLVPTVSAAVTDAASLGVASSVSKPLPPPPVAAPRTAAALVPTASPPRAASSAAVAAPAVAASAAAPAATAPPGRKFRKDLE